MSEVVLDAAVRRAVFDGGEGVAYVGEWSCRG